MTELENLRTENEELKARNSELEAKEKTRQETAINRGWWLTRFLTRVSMGRNFETRARTALSSWSVWRPGKDIPREETISMFAAYLSSRLRMGFLIAITAILGLVPTYFLWRQTILMGKQTNALDRQNNFIAFEQTNRFRDLLKPDEEKMKEAERTEGGEFQFWPKPNMTRVEQLVILAETEYEITEGALRPLIQDENPTIANGATLALFKIQKNQGIEINLLQAKLGKAYLEHAYLEDANLFNANLFNANLSKANLSKVNLAKANLSKANLSKANLSEANLEDAYLEYAYLEYAYLRYAYLEHAYLEHTNLKYANLEYASLGDANLLNANLENANLKHAYLKHAYLTHASLFNANLEGANLEGANLCFILGWQHENWKGTNILGVKNAPDGFKKWALAYGAVEETTFEWAIRVNDLN